MARSRDTTRTLNRLAGRALAGIISLVRRTSRVVYEPADALSRLAADHPSQARAVHPTAAIDRAADRTAWLVSRRAGQGFSLQSPGFSL